MTWAELFHMGGYAPYVWGAYGLTLAAVGAEVLLLVRRRRHHRDEPGIASRRKGGHA